MKCINCNGNHTAASEDGPRYQKEIQVLKIKNEKKLTYAEAAKQYNERTSGPTVNANAIQFEMKRCGVLWRFTTTQVL